MAPIAGWASEPAFLAAIEHASEIVLAAGGGDAAQEIELGLLLLRVFQKCAFAKRLDGG